MSQSVKIVKTRSRKKGALSKAAVRVRIVFEDGVRIGPGKIDLLEALERTGSISGAGRAMNMSYRRAWVLIAELNGLFKTPVVLANAGGTGGGGAQLTEFGRDLIAAYRRVEQRSLAAIQEELAPFASEFS